MTLPATSFTSVLPVTADTEWQVRADGVIEARVADAGFRFAMGREDVPLRELCDVALRNNSRRRFLFVSKALGRHWPVRPSALRGVARKLAEKLQARLGVGVGPVVFIGLAETATTLGQAVFREWCALGGEGIYIESTRRPTGGALAFRFTETHSHATAHLLHLPGEQEDPQGWFRLAREVVIVDDEATTALTAAGLAEEFRRWRGDGAAVSITLAVLLHWRAVGTRLPDALAGIESLAEGYFEFFSEASFPAPPPVQMGPTPQAKVRRGVRHGTLVPETLPPHWACLVLPGERVLVLGNGEFGFRPLLLAEKLEAAGAVAWVQATTRSPILPGGAIRHIRSFPAVSGEAYVEHLYNLQPDHGYDRVLLCLEDPVPPPEHPLWSVPRLEVRA